jgi:pyrimidine operon attenuation protein/uracil phosphoribosyltransferase
VGRNVQTAINEVIEVKLTEIDDAEKVLLMEK